MHWSVALLQMTRNWSTLILSERRKRNSMKVAGLGMPKVRNNQIFDMRERASSDQKGPPTPPACFHQEMSRQSFTEFQYHFHPFKEEGKEQTKPTKPNQLNQTKQTTRTNQTKQTKPNKSNQTTQTKQTKPNKPTQTKQINQTNKPNKPNSPKNSNQTQKKQRNIFFSPALPDKCETWSVNYWNNTSQSQFQLQTIAV